MTDSPTESLHEKTREFFETLGRCISAWAMVDDELFRIFRDCIGPYEQCAIIYYRTPGLDLRLNLTDEIVESVLPRPERKSGGHVHKSVKEWKALFNKFKKLLEVRRRLAHHPVSLKYEWCYQLTEDSYGLAQLFSGKPPKMGLLPKRIHAIDVGEHERLRKKSGAMQSLTERDLLIHLSSVRTLANDLNEFSRVVLTRRLEESPPTTNPQGSDS